MIPTPLTASYLKSELITSLRELIRLQKGNLIALENRSDFTTNANDFADQELYLDEVEKYSLLLADIERSQVTDHSDTPHDSQCASRIPMKFHKAWACDCWKARA